MTPGLRSRPGPPIGYHVIHPDVSLNFQMNRFFGLAGDVSMPDEMRTVASRIKTYADWHREFAALATVKPATFWLALQVITAWLDSQEARPQRG